MQSGKIIKSQKCRFLISGILLATSFSIMQTSVAGPVHAFYADEHNTTPTSGTGNKILEIDIENMTLVNTLNVPGNLGHHADNGENSKIYGVPKGSGFINVIELSKDQNGTTSMNLTKKIPLTHKPRSGDAINKKYNIMLMAAANRPMGSFINLETDKVVGTIGENVDCTLTDGSKLLSHADANTIASATKYQCATAGTAHGGDQISGHPYWLTPDIAAIVDRTNNQISVYQVWQEGLEIKSYLLNHLKTQTSIHQIVPRDRTSLPGSQQADFYAVEEGEHVRGIVARTNNSDADYAVGKPHALLKMKLTTRGLTLDKRMPLQRTQPLSKVKSDRILAACVANYRGQNRNGRSREQTYIDLFRTEGIPRVSYQDAAADFPVECFFPGIPGGHNADFAPNNKHIYVGMAGGALSVIDVDRWKIVNNLDIGIRSGPGHTCFSAKHNLALTTNHGVGFTRVIRNINTNRPTISQYLPLGFTPAGLLNTKQSHTCYIDEKEEFYYNFYTDGGVFYKMNLADIAANRLNGNATLVTASLVTGGIPIQGSFIDIDTIKSNNPGVVFKANHDEANSNGSAVMINVLTNDTGVNLVLEMVDPASHGKVEISAGQARYTPNIGYSGKDGFWYGISSSGGATWEWAYAEITVNSSVPYQPLKGVSDAVTTDIGKAITINVLANDTGTGLYLGWVDTPSNGRITTLNNRVVYTPNAGFRGVDAFWYEVLDSRGESTWAEVRVTVGTALPPAVIVLAKNDTARVARGRTVTVDVIANDSGNSLEVYETDQPWIGTVRIVNNKLVYTAAPNMTGTIDVWYGVKDPNWNDSWAKVTITVTR